MNETAWKDQVDAAAREQAQLIHRVAEATPDTSIEQIVTPQPIADWLREWGDGMLDGTARVCEHLMTIKSPVPMFAHFFRRKTVTCGPCHAALGSEGLEDMTCDFCRKVGRIKPFISTLGVLSIYGGCCRNCAPKDPLKSEAVPADARETA